MGRIICCTSNHVVHFLNVYFCVVIQSEVEEETPTPVTQQVSTSAYGILNFTFCVFGSRYNLTHDSEFLSCTQIGNLSAVGKGPVPKV